LVLGGCAAIHVVLTLMAERPPLEERVKLRSSSIVTEYYLSNTIVKVEGMSTRTNRDGSPKIRYRKHFRQGSLALMETWGPGAERGRLFYRRGKAVYGEVDVNGDGAPDAIAVTEDNGEPWAIFIVGEDGLLELADEGMHVRAREESELLGTMMEVLLEVARDRSVRREVNEQEVGRRGRSVLLNSP